MINPDYQHRQYKIMGFFFKLKRFISGISQSSHIVIYIIWIPYQVHEKRYLILTYLKNLEKKVYIFFLDKDIMVKFVLFCIILTVFFSLYILKRPFFEGLIAAVFLISVISYLEYKESNEVNLLS